MVVAGKDTAAVVGALATALAASPQIIGAIRSARSSD